MASTPSCSVTISHRGTLHYHWIYAMAFPLGNLINISWNLTIIQITKLLSRALTASYIQDKVTGERMSGPFTWDQLKKEARGNVIVSPLGVVDKAGEPGKLRIICDLSFKGKAPFSVNDRIDKDAFRTKWGIAVSVIDLVSLFLLFHPICSLAMKALYIVNASCNGKRSKFLVLMQHAWVHLGDVPIPPQPFTYGESGLVSAAHPFILS
jgi:hypothetical protein